MGLKPTRIRLHSAKQPPRPLVEQQVSCSIRSSKPMKNLISSWNFLMRTQRMLFIWCHRMLHTKLHCSRRCKQQPPRLASFHRQVIPQWSKHKILMVYLAPNCVNEWGTSHKRNVPSVSRFRFTRTVPKYKESDKIWLYHHSTRTI